MPEQAEGINYPITFTVEKAAAAEAQKQIDTVKTKLGGLNQRIEDAATKADRYGMKMMRVGMAFRQFGDLLGNDTLTKVGQLATGIGGLADSMGDLVQMVNRLKSMGSIGTLLGTLGAAAGGAGIGAGIYDATIGKQQNTNAGRIIDQTVTGAWATANGLIYQAQGYSYEEGYAAVMNQAAARFSQSVADFERAVNANNKYAYKNDLQNASTALVREGIFSAGEAGMGGGGLSLSRLKEEKAKYEQILADLESGKMQEGPAMFLGKAQTRLKMIVDAIDALEGKMKENADKWSGAIGNAKGIYNRMAGALQAGQQANKDFAQGNQVANYRYTQALYEIEIEIGKKRAQIAQNYAQDLIKFDQQYYQQRQQVAEQYGAETAKLEQEHQKNIRRMQEDHQDRLKKLVESRDALAVEDEIDQYNKERQRAEEDYADMMQQRQADYARQLREMERAHNEQRQQRQSDYQQQLRDLDQYQKERRAQELKAYSLMISEIMTKWREAIAEITGKGGVTNNTTTNNTKSATVTNNITSNLSADQIEGVVYGAIAKAFG